VALPGLLLHCAFASKLWGFVFKTFGIHWVILERVVDLLFGWRKWFGKNFSAVWNLVPLCLMWTIWQERNRRIFEDLKRSGNQLLEYFSGLLFDWSRVWGFTAFTSLLDFIASLSAVYFLKKLFYL
jgi:hypothetical protein